MVGRRTMRVTGLESRWHTPAAWGDLLREPAMLRKAIGATFILLLMTQVVSAQQDSGSAPPRPGVHFKDDKPSRTKEQKEYGKSIDRE